MYVEVTAKTIEGRDDHVSIEGVDQCPRCHLAIHPKIALVAKLYADMIQAVFQCTSHDCRELFVATYRFHGKLVNSRQAFDLSWVGPIKARPTTFPKTVVDTSPTFVAVFNQSLAAEAQGLEQLVGIGLRKALEFLIKDFASSQHPDKAGQIRAAKLADCIGQYVNDQNVKECAKRATWLGNDETHYVRRWETKDVNDLKTLVRLTVNWIDNVLLTKQYMDEMEQGKK